MCCIQGSYLLVVFSILGWLLGRSIKVEFLSRMGHVHAGRINY